MCGRYGLDGKRIEIEATFAAKVLVDLQPRYNIAPTTPVLVIKDSPQGRIGTFQLWGLIPPWAKDPTIANKLINARAETAAEKPSFKNALRRRRCILPASGFFEWQKLEGGRKQPFWIHPTQGGLLALAGIWEQWQGPNGEELETCAILTTTPNEVMAPLHDRMPVILGPEAFEAWFDHRSDRTEAIAHLLRPCPASWLAAHPVASLVGNPRNDGPELIEPIHPEPFII